MLKMFSIVVLVGALSAHESSFAAATPVDCAGCIQDDSSWGAFGVSWLFTPNPLTNSNGVCDAITCEWDAPGCKFRGTLKVTNTTGAAVDLFHPDGTGPINIPNAKSKTVTVNSDTGCGQGNEPQFVVQNGAGVDIAAYRLNCTSCTAPVEE